MDFATTLEIFKVAGRLKKEDTTDPIVVEGLLVRNFTIGGFRFSFYPKKILSVKYPTRYSVHVNEYFLAPSREESVAYYCPTVYSSLLIQDNIKSILPHISTFVRQGIVCAESSICQTQYTYVLNIPESECCIKDTSVPVEFQKILSMLL